MNDFSIDGLRTAAIRSESSGKAVSLASVWKDLADGSQRVVDAFFTPDRCFLVLAPAQGSSPGLRGRRRYVLEKLLSGQSAKALAIDLDVSVSTVSQDAKLALNQLGFNRTAGRVHPLLVMVARSATTAAPGSRGLSSWFSYTNETLRVVGAPRPDDRLGPVLPPAEFAVVRALVEGRNYREIAAGRGTSTRTVANQLAAAFRKLGVSGRGHLLEHLANGYDAGS